MPEWEELLLTAGASRPTAIRAETFVKAWQTASRPALLTCDDGNDYVVKGRQAGRMIVNDQIIARLAERAKAPTGSPALVDVPQELIDGQSDLSHFVAGVAHGTRWIADCGERAGIEFASQADNRPRFAALALLFGWLSANDHQFIYENAAPHRVYSVDHGHFFPGGPDWTTAGLAAAPAPAPFAELVASCSLTADELEEAKRRFAPISDEAVASAVSAPPDDWGVSHDERAAVADFIATRRDVLFA